MGGKGHRLPEEVTVGVSQTVLGRVHGGGGAAASLEGPKVPWYVGPREGRAGGVPRWGEGEGSEVLGQGGHRGDCPLSRAVFCRATVSSWCSSGRSIPVAAWLRVVGCPGCHSVCPGLSQTPPGCQL